MNTPQTVLTPQHTAKYPHVEFVIVNDEQRQLNELLSARPEVVADVKPIINNVISNQTKPVIIYNDKTNTVIQSIRSTKPFVKSVTNKTTKVIRVGGYMSGVLIINVVKYSLIFLGALVGGLIMSFVDLFQNDNSFDESENYDKPFDQGYKGTSFNNSTFNNCNIQINQK